MGEQFARVIVDIDAPHLDEDFDYRIPESLARDVFVGSLVKVRFRGRLVDAYVVDIRDDSDFQGRILPITRVVVAMPLVTREILKTVTYIATRYCASRSQILSFIVPRRVAAVEKQLAPRIEESRERGEGVFAPPSALVPGARVVQTCLPGEPAGAISALVQSQMETGQTTIVLAPTAHSSEVLATSLEGTPGVRVGHIDADQGPTKRYRTYLRSLLGDFDVLVGTRSAVWTPMPMLGGIVIWDDGDDRYVEQRAPRFEALDVCVARSHVEGVSLASLAYARSVKAQALVNAKWAEDVVPSPQQVRQSVPRLQSFDAYAAQREGPTGSTRLPDAAFRLIRAGLETGSVLIQVPAAGYITEEEDRRRVGSDRIGQELAAAFAKARVVVSSSTAGVVREVQGGQQIVVATAGAEPTTPGGYAAVIITGAASLAYGERLDTLTEAMRRWMGALALGRPTGPALIVGEVPPVLWDSLVLWRPQKLSEDVLSERQELGFPPARWVVAIEGARASVEVMVAQAQRALGQAQFHMPGEPYSDLALIGEATVPGENGDAPRLRVTVSVAPRNIQVLMGALGEARRALSRQGSNLPQVDVNPRTLAPWP